MLKNNRPGVAIFAFNRPNHLKKTLKSLSQNLNANNYDIFIFCDGPKNNSDKKKIKEVRKISKNYGNFKSKKYFFRKANYGLYNSLKYGISKVLKLKKSVIILEDDIITNKYFLNFMFNALNFFNNQKNIGSVTGYSYANCDQDMFLSQRHASWGWGTWRHVWDKMKWDNKYIKKYMKKKNFKKEFNRAGNDMHQLLEEQLDGQIDTMDIIFNFNCFIKKKFCVCPKNSMLYNIGLDGTGIHCKKNDKVFNNFDKNFYPNNYKKLKVENKILKNIYNSFKTPMYLRIKNKIFDFINN